MTETYRYEPDPGRRRGLLRLLNSPELLGEHESPRQLAKKVFISRMGRRISELVKTICYDNQLFVAGAVHITIKGKDDIGGKDGQNTTEVIHIEGDGFSVIAHVGLPVEGSS